jgi:hypothetical protein
MILFIFGCKETAKSIIFEEPQPQNINNLNEIPTKIIGTYYDYEHEKSLHINKTLIYTSEKLKDTLSISLLSEYEKINQNIYYNSKTKQKYPIHKINDTLFSGYELCDTIFNLKENDVLKKFKGNYFLNLFNDKNDWDVKKLLYTKDVINISDISSANDIVLLNEIMDLKDSISIPITIKPTKKQGFTNGTTYIRKKI